MTEHASDLDVTDARQGRRGLHAFTVLVVSLALGLAVLATVWMVFAGGFEGKTGSREAPPAVARSVTADPAAPVRQTEPPQGQTAAAKAQTGG